MKLRYMFNRIIRFVYNRRHELLDKEFWITVGRIVKNRFNFWEKVNKKEFVENLEIIKQRPWNIHVELTNLCNANCIFCAYQYQTRPHTFMSDNIYNRVLDEYCAIGGGDFMIQVVVGDPAIDPKFIQRIQQARKRKEINSIETITNAIAFKSRDIKKLIHSGLSKLSISTAPFDEDLYKSIYRNKSYKKVIRNIRLLLKENHTAGCPIDIKLCFRSNLTMKETLSLPDYKMIATCGHHTVEFNTDYDTWTGEIKEDDLLSGMNIRPKSNLENEPCIWLYDGPIVFADGNVGLCGCRDFNANSELIVGNIVEHSLMDIWRSDKVEQLRESFFNNKPPDICNKCTTYVNLNLFRTKPGSKRAFLTKKRMINSEFCKIEKEIKL